MSHLRAVSIPLDIDYDDLPSWPTLEMLLVL